MTTPLTALCPLDGRYADKLDSLRPLLSESALIHYRVLVEARWLLYLADHHIIPELAPLSPAQRTYIEQILADFSLQDAAAVKELERSTNHDVKACEYFLQKKLSSGPNFGPYLPFIHFGCTSEDINNLAYALMLKHAIERCVLPLLQQILSTLAHQADQYATLAMLARTHGQSATPTTLGKELINWVARLQRQLQQLHAQPYLGKFNGAVGNYNAHQVACPEVDWPTVARGFVESLGLSFNPLTTQIEPHDYVAETLQNLTRINTILLDVSRDIWGYISLGYFSQQTTSHEVGSSTMPHKVNPIDFENAEGNLGIANALNEHLALKLPISRWQRDLSDSTCLRNLGVALGYGLLAYYSLTKGLGKISANQPTITADLADRWELLAEPIQTVMRRHGMQDAYEQLKALTRGKPIDRQLIRSFIEALALPAEVKQKLLSLTPTAYLGYAVSLTRENKP